MPATERTILRSATDADAGAIASLLAELGHPLAAEAVPARLTAVESDRGEVIVAVPLGGSPVGLVALASHEALHAPGRVAWIMALVTARTSRRCGVGRMLVQAAFRWAQQRGCIRLTVTSAEHRADAHAFYPRCGLPYTGRRFAAPVLPSDHALPGVTT